MKIKEIEIIWLDIPFHHEVAQRNMERTINGWHISEICRVTTDNGIVGYGETMPHYTWGVVTKEAIERAKGKNPFALLWDDSLGAGLRMACFDVAGKAAGVPVYRLLGRKCRDWCPISWWAFDMPPEDFEIESRRAVAAGYMSFKQKARPWRDVYEQAQRTIQAVPANFKLDFDFTETLVNASNAVPVLKELEKFPNIATFEAPILQSDVAGARRIRQQIGRSIAMHHQPLLLPNIRDSARLLQGSVSRHPGIWGIGNGAPHDLCDGFVNEGSPTKMLQQARIAQAVNMPFWIQMVGTAWTTAMALHIGAVCTHAQWPAVTCLNLYADQLVTQPITVHGGYARVPEAPGLGIEFDETSLKWRVDSPNKPNVEAVYAFVRDQGERTWYHGEYGPAGYREDFLAGNQPICERGVRLERWDNDGSKEWRELAARTRVAPVRSRQ